MKKILIIYGHPVKDTFSEELLESYNKGALTSGAEVKSLILNKMVFELNLSEGYRVDKEMEADIQKAQEYILWADHLLFIYPNWWGTYPALVKGFIDRTFLPGFAFKYKNGHTHPEKLLKGKTARIMVSMDNTVFYYRYILNGPGNHAMKKATLKFCGISPVKITMIGSIRKSTKKRRQKWLNKTYKLGIADAT